MSGVLWLTLDPEMHTHMCTIPHENTYISTVLVFEIFVPFFFFHFNLLSEFMGTSSAQYLQRAGVTLELKFRPCNELAYKDEVSDK